MHFFVIGFVSKFQHLCRVRIIRILIVLYCVSCAFFKVFTAFKSWIWFSDPLFN